jgi:hypothetical protein
MAEQAHNPHEPEAAASGVSRDAAEPIPVVRDALETVRVRRAPKYSVFVGVGAALGILAALILTYAFDGTVSTSENTGLVYSQGQVFGFLVLICITVGVVLGGVTALILDRVLARRTRDVRVDRESIRIED